MALPVYIATNMGSKHCPLFRASVLVDNTGYISPSIFSTLKAAEQDAARVALEGLPEKFPEEEYPVILENTTPFSKSVLNEYATMLKVAVPKYNTVQLGGAFPLFVSSVIFQDSSYTGDTASRKKDAEKLAASAAIMSILADGATSGILYEMVKKKYTLFAKARLSKYDECIDDLHDSLVAMGKIDVTLSLDHKGKEVTVPVAANNNETRIALPEPSSEMPEHVPSPQATVTEVPYLNLPPELAGVGPVFNSVEKKKL
ncbi:hypothetical protein Fmac_014452 [Flemingia macrophylla]|uniref:DRBM domain-containing protein n=1 Tax=Flemingia macrophylla TaxID=520843 RepID=A0ABD1MBT9_9FABA